MSLYKDLIENGNVAIDVIKKSEGQKNLLIGNGFSLSLDPETFNYQKLADELYKSDDDPDIKSYLDQFGQDEFSNKNIEELVDNLGNLLWWCKKEPLIKSKESNEFEKKIEKIKISLIKKISNKNKKSYEETQNRFLNCKIFLDIFDKIFTTNYDLLLYFSLFTEHQESKWKDGFTSTKLNSNDYLTLNQSFSNPSSNVNFFYLHGAAHLYLNHDDQPELRKMKKLLNKDSDISGAMKIYDKQKNKSSIILGGNGEKKKKEIQEIPYLKQCLEYFENINGILVTFGFSFSQWDSHLLNAIFSNNKIEKLYVGIYLNEIEYEAFRILYILEKYKNVKKSKITLEYFNSKDINIWDTAL